MTILEIKNLKPNSILWDDDIKGLHVRSRAHAKSFMLYYRTKQGVQRRPKLGDFGEITLNEAKRRALLILNRVAVGEDPKGEWDASKKEMTVKELFAHTVKHHWSDQRYIDSGWKYNVENLWDNHLNSEFGSKKLTEIDGLMVRRWHSGYKKSPYAGNRALDVLSKMFKFAEEEGIRQVGTNPCSIVSSHPEKKRSRYATVEEFRKISALLDKESETNPNAAAFLYVLIFTGSRPRAIERATKDQLKRITMPSGAVYGQLTFKGKTSSDSGSEETVILPPQAMRVIDKLPKRMGSKSLLNIKMPRNLWEKIRKEAGCEDLWARDFRRLFASVGKSIGLDMGSIGDLLNHSSTQTTKTYAKLFDNKRIESAIMIADKLEEMGR